MQTYFIGNVLSPTETQPEADDPTFAFTREESEKLDLTNCPIRMEHDEDMQVGKVIKSWDQDDGSKWVIGKLNNNSYLSRFANYAVNKDPLTDVSYYTGLSLQHTHTQYASGKTEKKAVEISLCVDPRRDDCRIAMVRSNSLINRDQTEKITYKMKKNNTKMSEAQTPTVETTEQQPQETPTEENKVEMSPEAMMKVIVEQQKKLEAQEQAGEAEKSELAELKAMLAKQEEDALKKDRSKSMAMVRALTDQWAEDLDKEAMSDAQKESMIELARNYPRESMELLRVAHCASKKAKARQSEFESFRKEAQSKTLTEKFDAVMHKRKPETVVHAASTKKARKNDVQTFLSAMKQYSVSGSARDHMEKVSQIGKRRKRNPYFD